MSDDGLLRLYQQFGELKANTEQAYQQVVAQFKEWQQQLAAENQKLQQRLVELESKCND